MVCFRGDPTGVLWFADKANEDLLEELECWHFQNDVGSYNLPECAVVERVESFGMRGGQGLMETCWWGGRFFQAASAAAEPGIVPRGAWLLRKQIKSHLCGKVTVGDSAVRTALLFRWGTDHKAIVGKPTAPGPLFGLKKHHWAALAAAVVWWEKFERGTLPPNQSE